MSESDVDDVIEVVVGIMNKIIMLNPPCTLSEVYIDLESLVKLLREIRNDD